MNPKKEKKKQRNLKAYENWGQYRLKVAIDAILCIPADVKGDRCPIEENKKSEKTK